MSPTKIEWSGETWNPTTGCDRVSPGCDNCYALKMSGRLKKMGQAKYQRDGDPRTSGPGFGLTLHPDALDLPLRRKKPTTWFVNSMSDLFHPEIPDAFIGEVFGVMALSRAHTFQILTKRPQRMASLVPSTGFKLDTAIGVQNHGGLPMGFSVPTPNVWLGTSIENDRYAFRADHLRNTPAAVRFLSLEPLIGPVPSLDLTGIHWVIVGGESGPKARPMHPQWVRDIRDECLDAGVPFFFKQWGAWVPEVQGVCPSREAFFTRSFVDLSGAMRYSSESAPVYRVGKKAAGRELDGQVWDEMPEHAGAVA